MKIGTKIGLVLGGVVIVGYFVSAATLGAEIGQPCDKEWGCKGLSASCLEGDDAFCSRSCTDASECPTGWTCGDVAVLTFDGKSQTPKESSTKMCLPGS